MDISAFRSERLSTNINLSLYVALRHTTSSRMLTDWRFRPVLRSRVEADDASTNPHNSENDTESNVPSGRQVSFLFDNDRKE